MVDTDYQTFLTQFECPALPNGICSHPMVGIYSRTKRMSAKTLNKALEKILSLCVNQTKYVDVTINKG